jgi:glutathionyl-hydroquinone reductase
VNGWVYHNINNGVYRCGFATTQAAYEEAFDALFAHLDKAEAILATHRCARLRARVRLQAPAQ